MSVLVDKNTRLLVQGISGKTGAFHTKACREYGTKMVAGVGPGKAGQEFEGIPLFDTVADAKRETGATVSVIYVPVRESIDIPMFEREQEVEEV